MGVAKGCAYVFGAVVLLISLVIGHWWVGDPTEKIPIKDYANFFDSAKYPQAFFVSDYELARRYFREGAESVKGVKVELTTLVLDEENDLTIDVALFRGDDKRLLIHSSGVHGAEGYVGSGIQSSILRQLDEHVSFISDNGNPRPTVMLIHSVNPFGMKFWRRWNENNVDLNRNCIFDQYGWTNATEIAPGIPNPEEFHGVLQRDSNIAGYDDYVAPIFNLKQAPEWWNVPYYIFKAIWSIARYGQPKLKRALVGGTYSHPKGLFYGGRQLQKNYLECILGI